MQRQYKGICYFSTCNYLRISQIMAELVISSKGSNLPHLGWGLSYSPAHLGMGLRGLRWFGFFFYFFRLFLLQ